MENKQLFKKLVKVLASADKVRKSGYNKHQNYEYIMEKDLLEAIRPELIKEGIFVFTSTKVTDVREMIINSKPNILTTVECTHTFVDSDSGESFSVTSVGSGIDNTDKGIFKAISGSYKYFILKNFMLSGDDDPENDGETPVKQTKPAPKPVEKPKEAPPVAKKEPEPVKPVENKPTTSSFSKTTSTPVTKSGFGRTSKPAEATPKTAEQVAKENGLPPMVTAEDEDF